MIPFKKITIKSKAGLVLINYSHAILDQEIQNNGGCPEAAGPDRKTHAAQKISEISSSILVRELIVFQQTCGAQKFSKPIKKHHIYYWVFRLIFHSWLTWYPLDISRTFERTTHMTISSTLKFTNTLPYAWKYHRIDSTELIQKRGFD